mmetsp:Transcript_128952/g.412975  ORF Transcript_128952/g.412975 Transcript_128952/m.412975 type:complete len:515 (-) Transcript_128952:267-1811(-)
MQGGGDGGGDGSGAAELPPGSEEVANGGCSSTEDGACSEPTTARADVKAAAADPAEVAAECHLGGGHATPGTATPPSLSATEPCSSSTSSPAASLPASSASMPGSEASCSGSPRAAAEEEGPAQPYDLAAASGEAASVPMPFCGVVAFLQPAEAICQVLLRPLSIPACSGDGASDCQVLERLAASEKTLRRLLRASGRAQLLLRGGGSGWCTSPALAVELYGSLALSSDAQCRGQRVGGRADRPRHFVRPSSDVDLAVLMQPGSEPEDALRRLLDKGSLELVSRSSMPRFSTEGFSLVGSIADEGSGGTAPQVSIDLTCITSQLQYERFYCRQEAFRETFWQERTKLEARFGDQGATAFDVYTFLLKAFAAKVSKGALSGFQALCLGLLALQLRLYELSGHAMPTGVVLLECFLRFCCVFFGSVGSDAEFRESQRLRSSRCCAADLSLGGRLLPRMSSRWACELYLLSAEVQMQVPLHERMNIAHSVQPEVVATAARQALARSCRLGNGECWWV